MFKLKSSCASKKQKHIIVYILRGSLPPVALHSLLQIWKEFEVHLHFLWNQLATVERSVYLPTLHQIHFKFPWSLSAHLQPLTASKALEIFHYMPSQILIISCPSPTACFLVYRVLLSLHDEKAPCSTAHLPFIIYLSSVNKPWKTLRSESGPWVWTPDKRKRLNCKEKIFSRILSTQM